MTTIYFYTEVGFKGEVSDAVEEDQADLATIGFLKRAKSMKVSGGLCVVFKETGFKDDFELFREGEYKNLDAFSEAISSVRVVKGGLGNPKITIYEKEGYRGVERTLTAATPNLNVFKMNDMVSSHKVTNGAWCLYEKEDYKGDRIVALAGDELPKYESIGFDNTASSLKPYQ
ncbi:epidermal differentiation-specific protein-like [Lissotriton helveticus]